jgi:hypothetical protein
MSARGYNDEGSDFPPKDREIIALMKEARRR